MTTRLHQPGLLLSLIILALSGLVGLEQAAGAATAKSKKETKPSIVQPTAADQSVPQKSTKVREKKVLKNEAERTVTAELQGKKSSDRVAPHTGRQKKVRKKFRPLAMVQPKPDLSYHGILEQPRRYDPSRAHRKGGVANPQASELLHDHFQELDKNRDGMIDPFERALGRLDIDRDLTNRQWE